MVNVGFGTETELFEIDGHYSIHVDTLNAFHRGAELDDCVVC
jgi:hypothetical protein